MRRTEFEKRARELWWAAWGEAAPGNRAAIERMVRVTVGLAFGEKLLDQDAPQTREEGAPDPELLAALRASLGMGKGR